MNRSRIAIRGLHMHGMIDTDVDYQMNTTLIRDSSPLDTPVTNTLRYSSRRSRAPNLNTFDTFRRPALTKSNRTKLALYRTTAYCVNSQLTLRIGAWFTVLSIYLFRRKRYLVCVAMAHAVVGESYNISPNDAYRVRAAGCDRADTRTNKRVLLSRKIFLRQQRQRASRKLVSLRVYINMEESVVVYAPAFGTCENANAAPTEQISRTGLLSHNVSLSLKTSLGNFFPWPTLLYRSPFCPSSFLFSHLPFRLPRLLLSRFLYRRSTVYTKVRIYSNLTVLFYLFSIDWNESASHGLGWSIESWNVDPLSWWAAYRIKSGSSVAILVQHFNDTVDLAEGTSAAQSRSFHRDRITNYNRARESRSNDRKQLRDPATLSTPLYSFIVTRER